MSHVRITPIKSWQTVETCECLVPWIEKIIVRIFHLHGIQHTRTFIEGRGKTVRLQLGRFECSLASHEQGGEVNFSLTCFGLWSIIIHQQSQPSSMIISEWANSEQSKKSQQIEILNAFCNRSLKKRIRVELDSPFYAFRRVDIHWNTRDFRATEPSPIAETLAAKRIFHQRGWFLLVWYKFVAGL